MIPPPGKHVATAFVQYAPHELAPEHGGWDKIKESFGDLVVDTISEFAPDFRIVYDTGGVLAERYHLKGMPTSFLIDRDGKVQSEHVVFRPADRDALTERIHTLLQTH